MSSSGPAAEGEETTDHPASEKEPEIPDPREESEDEDEDEDEDEEKGGKSCPLSDGFYRKPFPCSFCA